MQPDWTENLIVGVADPRDDFICQMLFYRIVNRSVHPLNQQRLIVGIAIAVVRTGRIVVRIVEASVIATH